MSAMVNKPEEFVYVTQHGVTRTLTREECEAEYPCLPLPVFVLRRDSPGRIAVRATLEQEERTLKFVVGLVSVLCIAAIIWIVS